MDEVLKEIIETIRKKGALKPTELGAILNRHNKRVGGSRRAFSKKRMLPYYLRLKEFEPEKWALLDIDDALEEKIFKTLRMKPRRTASGVATITVITKPHACSGNCLYCPNDVRMPKSYLHREPACQRAERNYFDPYLQVTSRLRALTQMGHSCDKVELIVLGGSWTDYPIEYQTWFIEELFRALNDADAGGGQAARRRAQYRDCGIDSRDEVLEEQTRDWQSRVNAGDATFNEAMHDLYGAESAWGQASQWQTACEEELATQQKINETAAHRVVGLVVETRPETLDAALLSRLRSFGCTKVQIGVQTLRPEVLALNRRNPSIESLVNAFELLRIFGFKLHTHFMVNLFGTTSKQDKQDYDEFVSNPIFRPDEIKIYPCVLVEGTGLVAEYARGAWRPYEEDELIDVLIHHILVTPPYTRVSRMIRDISAEDIAAGNKKTNLRQLVENTEAVQKGNVHEIRFREIALETIDADTLALEDVEYRTSNTCEHFLQWVTPQGGIAGFLRLSLPNEGYVAERVDELPDELGCAMIREVHVYGQVANLHKADGSVQHLGLGRKLVAKACEIASEAGFGRINVISSVGTREYYRNLGFEDGELYQYRLLRS